MTFKIKAAKRIRASDNPLDSYVEEVIPALTQVLGKPAGSGHNLTWQKPVGEVTIKAEMREQSSAKFGVSLSISIPEIGYRHLSTLDRQRGRSVQWFVDALFNFLFSIQKLPKYKKLDDGTRAKLLEFCRKHLGY